MPVPTLFQLERRTLVDHEFNPPASIDFKDREDVFGHLHVRVGQLVHRPTDPAGLGRLGVNMDWNWTWPPVAALLNGVAGTWANTFENAVGQFGRLLRRQRLQRPGAHRRDAALVQVAGGRVDQDGAGARIAYAERQHAGARPLGQLCLGDLEPWHTARRGTPDRADSRAGLLSRPAARRGVCDNLPACCHGWNGLQLDAGGTSHRLGHARNRFLERAWNEHFA